MLSQRGYFKIKLANRVYQEMRFLWKNEKILTGRFDVAKSGLKKGLGAPMERSFSAGL
jgi:hypothetical protein